MAGWSRAGGLFQPSLSDCAPHTSDLKDEEDNIFEDKRESGGNSAGYISAAYQGWAEEMWSFLNTQDCSLRFYQTLTDSENAQNK